MEPHNETISCHGGAESHERKQERLLFCECGRTYRLKTLLGLTPDRAQLQPFTRLQQSLDHMMRENGILYGGKKAKLLHGGENRLDGHPSEQEEWINLEQPRVTEFLRGGSWRIETVARVVHPSPELVAAFEKRLDGFRDMEALRAQFIRGRPRNPELHRRARAIVRDALRDGFEEDEIALYVGVADRTMRRIKKSE